MALDFKKIGDVELLEQVPDTANAVVEVDGAFKRVPGSNLGGGGIKTAIIKSSDYDDAIAGVQTMVAASEITFSCTNMTFEEAYSTMAAGEPLAVLFMVNGGGASCVYGATTFAGTALSDPGILLSSEDKIFNGDEVAFWGTEGIHNLPPK